MNVDRTGSGTDSETFGEANLPAAWSSYNDCVASASGNSANVTQFDFPGDSGALLDYATGNPTAVSVAITSDNLAGWDPTVTFDSGTDAYTVFNGIVNYSNIASYNADSPWYYEISFTGLESTKKYAFVTTVNRNNTYDPERWTKFSISGADTYRNVSSAGVTSVTEDVLKMNVGNNTAAGYVIAWTDITAADGSFTVRSENVGAAGPGDANKSYGFQAFMFLELAP
jgi:hypothetical protein